MNSSTNSKKILIFSAPYGSGHTRAAEALKAHLEIEGNEVVHIDILSIYKKQVQKGLQLPYTTITRRSPKLYGFMYNSMKSHWALRRYHRSLTPLIRHKQKEILAIIKAHKPDYIVCTHPTPGHILSFLTKKGHRLPPHFVQITDYEYHPLWYSEHTSGYLLSCNDMKIEMEYEGFKPQKLQVTGIPVDPSFFHTYDKQVVKQSLDLPEKPMYLVMTGGLGLVDPTEIISFLTDIPNDVHIVVITGKNASLFESMTKTYADNQNITVLSWTDRIREYMQAADIVCSKPGGITTTECLTLNKPLMVYKPIPGQELANTNYLLRNNLAVLFTSDPSFILSDAIQKLTPWREQFTTNKIPFIE